MSASFIPPGVIPNYVNPVSRGYQATDAALTSLVFAAACVGLRIFTKFRITRAPGWDDVCSVLALCFGIARLGLAFHLVDSGYGRHVWDVPYSKINTNTISIGIDQICYVIGILFAKLAVLILLFRIFGIDSRLRWVCFVLGPIIFLWSFISAVITIFRCRPIIAGWSLQYNWAHPHGSKCLDRIKLVTVFGWYNIISDFILILLPMPILWGMHLSWRKKIGVAVVFATGGVVCAISVIRQAILYKNNASGVKEADATWTEIPNYVWFSLELNIGIITGCLPVLQPLLRRIPSLLPTSLRSIFSFRSTTGKSNRSKKPLQEVKGIEMAEEGRAPAKKPSRESSDESLIDPIDNRPQWAGGIVRTDRYDSNSVGPEESNSQARAQQNAPRIYQG